MVIVFCACVFCIAKRKQVYTNNFFILLMSFILAAILFTSNVTGSSPHKPSCTARSVPCPYPVFAREPYNNTSIPFTCCKIFFSSSDCKKSIAAFHGPSVWLLLGPTPILNISNMEMASWLNFFIIERPINLL